MTNSDIKNKSSAYVFLYILFSLCCYFVSDIVIIVAIFKVLKLLLSVLFIIEAIMHLIGIIFC